MASLWSTLNAQDLQLERIPPELGLSQNNIKCLMQDRKGFLWVGTQDGLNRFDGYQFKVFRNDPFDSKSLSDNRIEAVLQDRVGRIWVATEYGLNLFDAEQEIFYRILPDSTRSDWLSNPITTSIMEDRNGSIWLSTVNGLNKLVLPAQSRNLDSLQITSFMHDPDNKNSVGGTLMENLVQDEQGTYWLQLSDRRFQRFVFDEKSNTYIFSREVDDFPDSHWKKQIENGQKVLLGKGRNGKIWMGVGTGLVCWDSRKKAFNYYSFKKSDQQIDSINWINYGDLLEDKDGKIWVSHYGGLIAFNTRTGFFENYNPESTSLDHAFYYGVGPMLEDKGDILWFGTRGKGLFKYDPNTQRFSKVGAKRNEKSLWQGNSLRSIYKTRDGNLWIGPTDKGLFVVDRQSGLKRAVTPVPAGENNYGIIYSMLQDRSGALWLATEEFGLLKFSKWQNNGKVNIEGNYHPMPDSEALMDAVVCDVIEDRNGKIWIVTGTHLCSFDQDTEQFTRYPFPQHDLKLLYQIKFPLPSICLDQQGTFWIGTQQGILKFDPKRHSFKLFQSDSKNPHSLSNDLVQDIVEDPKNPDRFLWIGTTGGGLNRFDIQQETFTYFSEKDGLPDMVVYAILPDQEGNLWLSTNKGLSLFNPENQSFRNFDEGDGLQDIEFNSRAHHKSEDGELFFGGISGFNAFYPQDVLYSNLNPPAIVITDLKISNKSVRKKEGHPALKKAIEYADEVVLSYQDKTFSFEFAVLNYTASSKNSYAYKMYGFDEDWQQAGTNRSATYTNLDPGEYTFQVKGANSDGIWNEEGIAIKVFILPPWWRTTWAYALYLGLAFLLIYLFRRNERRQQKLKYNLNLEKIEAEKLKEIDQLKSRFYTNITHEFRTPLTVILGIADQLGGNSKLTLKESAQLIRRNGKNLLGLINQLLALSKLESNSIKLNLQQADIVPFLRYVTESFQTYANSKNLQLRFFTLKEKLVMDYDPAQLRQILTNLLSNAFKFTPSEGVIEVRLTQHEDNCQIAVRDTGIGIAAENLPFIFDRFYQTASPNSGANTREGEGSGIGLAHTQELVKLMKGKIEVESILEQGTKITVSLPICNDAPLWSTSFEEFQPANTPMEHFPLVMDEGHLAKKKKPLSKNEERPILLIIEDNADVVTYLKTCLQGLYQIEVAYNGSIGTEKALASIPDLIISDVMMPGKDGFEVCDTLKKDERTSHIPIILLTAKADAASKLEGLKSGADAYLAKPFDREELLVRLEKLIELRKRIKARFANILTDDKNDFPLEDSFLSKVKNIVAENSADEDFDLMQLCRAIGMSRSQLFRKMKALIGESPSHFIRSYRLQQGRKLLENTNLTISEITFRVGFKDATHFSKAFQEEFGITPSATRN
ncbi:MAG: hybrid sensor histidine kinase/response regulator [Saprospiraceae bacterium]|nr:MAG: hybrid sensor histidine kinase/response regulator [Saprospiraceae bacterium]